jgi:hypothetical protein
MSVLSRILRPTPGSKYENYGKFAIALAYRTIVRRRLSGLVRWTKLEKPEPGCTVIVGMCSKLPGVMFANLRCLDANKWPDLKETIIAVDNVEGGVSAELVERVIKSFPALRVSFLYYTREQFAVAEKMKLPFLYAWLSWCVCFKKVTTESVLIHDYDALILTNALANRYLAFQKSRAKIQGIRWYDGNGVLPDDRLATTFETFVRTDWIRGLRPIDLFNKVTNHGTRLVDYDILLDAQVRSTTDAERTQVDMELGDLAHPSQMIHQYTMFRKFPGKKQPCFALVVLPFFNFLSGDAGALGSAMSAIRNSPIDSIDLLADGSRINLSMLDTSSVDWMLKIMLQALTRLDIAPFREFFDYGSTLYAVAKTPPELAWVGDFEPPHRDWIEAAKRSPA